MTSSACNSSMPLNASSIILRIPAIPKEVKRPLSRASQRVSGKYSNTIPRSESISVDPQIVSKSRRMYRECLNLWPCIISFWKSDRDLGVSNLRNFKTTWPPAELLAFQMWACAVGPKRGKSGSRRVHVNIDRPTNLMPRSRFMFIFYSRYQTMVKTNVTVTTMVKVMDVATLPPAGISSLRVKQITLGQSVRFYARLSAALAFSY